MSGGKANIGETISMVVNVPIPSSEMVQFSPMGELYQLRPIRDIGVIVGSEIRCLEPYLGSYGMGGPGFLGLKLYSPNFVDPYWLILAVWAAEGKLNIRGKDLLDLVGSKIMAADLSERNLTVSIENRGDFFFYESLLDKTLGPGYDLCKHVYLSPTEYIWI